MNCEKCGAEIEDDTIFCPECGSYVELRKKGREQPEEKTTQEGTSIQTESIWKDQPSPEPAREEQKESSASPASFDWQSYHSPTPQEPQKPKKSKAPYIVMGVIGAAIVVALIYLVTTLTTAGNVKAHVEKSLKNTFKELGENEYSDLVEKLMKEDAVLQNLSLTLSYMTLSEYGVASDLLEGHAPSSFSASSTADQKEDHSKLELTGTIGDMNPVKLNLFASEDGFLIQLPDLYGEYFIKLSFEDMSELTGMELDWEAKTSSYGDGREEGIDALMETLSEWFKDAYQDMECRKTKTVRLDTGNRILDTDEYELIMSRKNYEKHIRRLPELIAANQTFMNWLKDTVSESYADDFLDSLEDMAESFMFDGSVREVIFCYVRTYQNKAVQLSVPLDYQEGDQTGEFVVSFFGDKNAGDDLRAAFSVTIDGDSVTADYRSVKNGEARSINFAADIAGMISAELSIDGEYNVTDSSYSYQIKNMELIVNSKNYMGESVGFSAGLNGSYTITKAEGFTVPDASGAKRLMDMEDEEQQELLLEIVERAIEGGYVPSDYVEQLSGLADSIRAGMGGYGSVGDNGGGDLDGSEYLTYEEFAERVKEIYGDLYSDEILRQLYEMYGNENGDTEGNYNPSKVTYSSNGFPYLFCDEEDLTLELQPPQGFELEELYSDGSELMYIREIGDTDQLMLDYYIVEEDMEEYMKEQEEYQQEYYTEAGYTTVKIGDTQYSQINGCTAAWFEYSASDTDGNRTGGFTAYIWLDGEHGLSVDLYSIFGSDEITEELLKECIKFQVVKD